RPLTPAIPGLGGFAGRTLHSLDYRVPEPFAGQNVLVAGVGSRAVDIALDLLSRTASVTLSTRRGAWIAPRFVRDRPLDHHLTRLSIMLPERLKQRGRAAVLGEAYRQAGAGDPATLWQAAQ